MYVTTQSAKSEDVCFSQKELYHIIVNISPALGTRYDIIYIIMQYYSGQKHRII